MHRIAVCCLMLRLLTGASLSEDKDQKAQGPAVTALDPAAVAQGYTGSWKIRGFKLMDATALSFTDNAVIKVEMGEKKAASPSPGLELTEAGESQIELKLTVSKEIAPGRYPFVIKTPGGAAKECFLEVLATASAVDEKEPDNGFSEAQVVLPGQTIRAGITEEKDVDVYRIEGKAGQRINAEIFAARAPSLLDAVLMLSNAAGTVLAVVDDHPGSRDPRMIFQFAEDGPLFLTVYDAHDHGGPWHGYQLVIKEEK